MTRTPKQLQASRTNGAQSSGPKTEQGKQRSSTNALRHGLRSNHLLLPGEDEAGLDALRTAYLTRFAPHDDVELALVERAIAAQWKLERARRLETELLASLMVPRQDPHDRRHVWPAKSALDSYRTHQQSPTLDSLQRNQHRLSLEHDRALKLLTRIQQNRPNEPKDEQPPAHQELTSAPESVSVFAPVRLCQEPAPTRSPQPDPGLPAAAAPLGDRGAPAPALVLATRSGHILQAEPSVAQVIHRLRQRDE